MVMTDLFSVKDKTVLITGGAGVLGSAIAKSLAAGGARVCIANYDEMRTNEVAKKIETEGRFA
jgi:NAD(P)-dependent dehydrogenase (short-subunit alcohol dehydrogenase family)